MEVELQAFLTLALHGSELLATRPSRLTPAKITHGKGKGKATPLQA
jgi:hypothetical protein